MTKDEIIRMATETWGYDKWKGAPLERLERFAALVAAHERDKQAEQEPIGYIDAADFRELCNGNERQYSLFTEDKGRMVAIYAAPVRTKDLADDELFEFYDRSKKLGIMCAFYEFEEIVRSVIAADREKNK